MLLGTTVAGICSFLSKNYFGFLPYKLKRTSSVLTLDFFLCCYNFALLEEQVKKHSVTKIFYDISLFEQIVQVISKFLQILGLLPRISKVFLDHQNNFFSQQVRTILVTKYHWKTNNFLAPALSIAFLGGWVLHSSRPTLKTEFFKKSIYVFALPQLQSRSILNWNQATIYTVSKLRTKNSPLASNNGHVRCIASAVNCNYQGHRHP